MTENDAREEALLIAEAQLLLAEKRTYYALLRTGLAVFTAAVALAALLIAAKDLHALFNKPWIATLTFGGLGIVAILGLFIFWRAEQKIKRLTYLTEEIEKKNKRLAELLV